MSLKTAPAIFTAFALSFLAGCNGPAAKKELLTVDFQKSQTLRYKFVSSRDIHIDWDTLKNQTRRSKKKTELMEMVVAYTPTEVDPFGLTTVQATCESVKIKRTSGTGQRSHRFKDAVENLPGKTFTFTVGPSGKIDDYSQLYKLIREIGKKAFRSDTSKGKIKEPDMSSDFIATQWFLWDSVSSIENPIEGVAVGQSWKSKLSVPTPMVMLEVRDVTYTLDQIHQTKKGRTAVIHSSYQAAKSYPRTWPIPYPSGRFRMSGTFGFLRGYRVLDLQGEGEELFNIDAGRTEQYNHQYQLQLMASYPFAVGVNTRITIEQNLTMQLLE